MSNAPNPPRWAEGLLRIALPRRDRETIVGDLVEEFRAAAIPERGLRGARAWYVRQVAVYATPLLLAVVVGIAHLAWNLYTSASDPYGEDTLGGDLLFIAPMFATPFVIGFLTTGRSGYVSDAARTGLLAMALMMAIGHIETFLRINLFLPTLQYRDDWVGLVDRFHTSGFHSLRAFANWEYFRDTPLLSGALAVIGGTLSVVGGAAARALR